MLQIKPKGAGQPFKLSILASTALVAGALVGCSGDDGPNFVVPAPINDEAGATPTPEPPAEGAPAETNVFSQIDFDSAEELPDLLSVEGNVELSSERAFSGANALKVSAQGDGYNRNFVGLDLSATPLTESVYGRMMLWVDDPGGNGGDFTFVQAEGKSKDSSGAPADTDVFYRYRVAGTARPGTVMANYDTRIDSDGDGQNEWGTDCFDHSQTVLPRETWACVEWYFDTTADELRYWINGTEVSDIHIQGVGEGCIENATQNGEWLAPQSFTKIAMGIEQYHTGVPARTMYVDDISLSEEYVGCPEGDYLNEPVDVLPPPEEFAPGPEDNHLSSDGTFSAGQGSFVGFYNVPGSGAATWDGEAAFTVSTATDEVWHVQLQHSVNLVEGEQYTLCFDARAAAERSISYDFDLGAAPFSSVMGEEIQSIALTTEYQAFTHTFTALADEDASRLVLNMGIEAGDVFIDNLGVFLGAECLSLE